MAGFQRITGRDGDSRERVISSLTTVVGDLLMASRTAGTVVAATSGSTVSLLQGGGIVQKASTSSDVLVDIQEIDFDTEYTVESASNSNVSHNYMRMALTDTNTVNNSGSDDSSNGVVYQTGVIGVTSDKKIKVVFLRALT